MELSNWSLGTLEVNLGVGNLERDAIHESMPAIVTLPAMWSRVEVLQAENSIALPRSCRAMVTREPKRALELWS
jgi:hypothetical protein